MPQPNLPVRADLEAFLQDYAGVAPGTISAMRAQRVLAAAAKTFEGAIDRRLLAGETATLQAFTPPLLGESVLLLPDFVALESVLYQPQGEDATPWTLGQEFALYPQAALQAGAPYQPYSGLLLAGPFWNPLGRWGLAKLAGALQITARWGYAAEVPDDAFEAILAKAAVPLLTGLGIRKTGGLTRFTDEDVTQVYDAAGVYAGVLPELKDLYSAAVRKYRRLSI